MNLWLNLTIFVALLVSVAGLSMGYQTLQRFKRAKAESAEAEWEMGPMVLLQKRALWSILSILVGSAACFWLWQTYSVTLLYQDTRIRLTFTLILIISLILQVIILAPSTGRRRRELLLDERDEHVLMVASRYQVGGLMLMNALWAIGGTEYYWEAGLIPVTLLDLMFWSIFLTFFLSKSVGIVISYWWMERYGDG